MVKRLFYTILFLLGGFSTATSQSGQVPIDIGKEVEKRILPPVLIEGEDAKTTSLRERMEHLNIPGISLAIIKDGEIILAEGFGKAHSTGNQPVTSATLFQAASLSKPVTASAVLSLVVDGNADLDEDINRYLESWNLPDNGFTNHEPVTIRRLLNHTAGVNVHGFNGYPAGQDDYPVLRDILEGSGSTNSESIKVIHTPGSQWQYSGGGYTVIQQILEDISGHSFTEIMKQTVFESLDMTGSTFEQNLPDSLREIAANAHVRGNFPLPTGWHIYPEKAAAGLWTTPSDLALWISEIQNAVINNESKIFTVAAAREMLIPDHGGWGLGVQINSKGDSLHFSHSGANEGFRSYLIGFVNQRHGIVIMTNSDNGSMIVPEITRTVAYHLNWPQYQPSIRTVVDLDPEKLDVFSGIYELETGIPLEITPGNNKLYVSVSGEHVAEFLPVSDTTFFDVSTDVRIEFLPAATGETDELKLIIEQHKLSGYRSDSFDR